MIVIGMPIQTDFRRSPRHVSDEENLMVLRQTKIAAAVQVENPVKATGEINITARRQMLLIRKQQKHAFRDGGLQCIDEFLVRDAGHVDAGKPGSGVHRKVLDTQTTSTRGLSPLPIMSHGHCPSISERGSEKLWRTEKPNDREIVVPPREHPPGLFLRPW